MRAKKKGPDTLLIPGPFLLTQIYLTVIQETHYYSFP